MASNSAILSDVGSELKQNPPAIVASTRRKFGNAKALSQSRAILLNKARKRGANIPKMTSGGY